MVRFNVLKVSGLYIGLNPCPTLPYWEAEQKAAESRARGVGSAACAHPPIGQKPATGHPSYLAASPHHACAHFSGVFGPLAPPAPPRPKQALRWLHIARRRGSAGRTLRPPPPNRFGSLTRPSSMRNRALLLVMHSNYNTHTPAIRPSHVWIYSTVNEQMFVCTTVRGESL